MFRVGIMLPSILRHTAIKMAHALESHACQAIVRYDNLSLKEETMGKFLIGLNACIVSGLQSITRSALVNGNTLQLVQRFGVGYENVDLEAARKQGVFVCNVPGANSESVADLTMGLIISLLRHIPQASEATRKYIWKLWYGAELNSKVLGIIGFGRIGQAVAIRARAHGMRILVYDPFVKLPDTDEESIESTSKEHLLQLADVVSLHVPLTTSTRALISADELALMKASAYLINTSRGGVVAENDLIQALRNGIIKGAALDVFAREPLPKESGFFNLKNVILTPHIGACTVEARDKQAMACVENCLRVSNGLKPRQIVNGL